MDKLNEREKQILAAIDNYIKQNKFSPTMREVGDMVGLSSTATVYHYINKLKKKGYISNHPSIPRTITIISES